MSIPDGTGVSSYFRRIAGHALPPCGEKVFRMRPRALSSFLAATMAVFLFAAACANKPTQGPVTTSFAVASASAPFFKYGPAQEFGADFTLAQGQRLTMIHRELGYSRVMTENGISGYVSNDDLKPAPPATPLPVKATPSPGFWARHRVGGGSNFKPSPQPLFDVNDVPPPPLPAGGEKPHSTPPFRY